MIEQHYGELCIDDALHASLEALLNRYTLPENAERLVLNGRQMSYYRHRQGLHPIEVQLKRESASSPWLVVFFASFSYLDDHSTTVEPELYFHLANRWCYQPDVGSLLIHQTCDQETALNGSLLMWSVCFLLLGLFLAFSHC
ncbi:DUF2787 family protein [Vibrio aestuarianus]|uniref:DUF2787 family protein n=2 Tax=Vibrio aestuarianus TaxID=28171 RepID=UPI0020CE3A0E|nr:DUF2787 family protein [Vibrio aestuarianus]